VSDVLPSLGEEGVQTCILRELVPEGRTATDETDPEVARLKASADMVETPWGDVWLSADEWVEAFDSRDSGTPHNEARDQVWDGSSRS
jgi:hypothetical protein